MSRPYTKKNVPKLTQYIEVDVLEGIAMFVAGITLQNFGVQLGKICVSDFAPLNSPSGVVIRFFNK